MGSGEKSGAINPQTSKEEMETAFGVEMCFHFSHWSEPSMRLGKGIPEEFSKFKKRHRVKLPEAGSGEVLLSSAIGISLDQAKAIVWYVITRSGKRYPQFGTVERWKAPDSLVRRAMRQKPNLN